jgi:o-succinylbenzoate synthase
MRIDRLELFLCRLPLVHFFETSFGRTYDRTFVLARMEGEGHEGWGEAVAEGHPYYSGETTETVWHIVTEFLAPLVVGREFDHPREVFAAMKRVRTHNMAKALLEMTAWDLYATMRGQSLSTVLGGTRPRIASGVSIGIQDSFDQLLEKVAKERAAGLGRRGGRSHSLPLRRHPAHGRRQRRLQARRWRSPGRSRSV